MSYDGSVKFDTSVDVTGFTSGISKLKNMEDKILSMYAKGMSRRDIAETIDEIYGFEMSHEMISKITDSFFGSGIRVAKLPFEEILHFPVRRLYVYHHQNRT